MSLQQTGIEATVELSAIKAAKRIVKSKMSDIPTHADVYPMIEKIALGAGLCNSKLSEPAPCPRCGAPEETPQHKYYTCPANHSNLAAAYPFLKQTKWLTKWASEENAPAELFFQGLAASPTHELDMNQVMLSVINEPSTKGTTVLCTDGGGG